MKTLKGPPDSSDTGGTWWQAALKDKILPFCCGLDRTADCEMHRMESISQNLNRKVGGFLPRVWPSHVGSAMSTDLPQWKSPTA